MTWTAAWPSQSLQLSRTRLLELRTTATSLPSDIDPEISAAMSKFLVVRSAGHIEFTVDECMHSFAIARSHPDIAQFVKAGLFNGRNPSPGKLVSHIGKMSTPWACSLDEFLNNNDQRVKRQLNFLVDRRNKIAHGQNENVALRKSLDLCDISLELSDWIVAMIDPR